MPHSAFFSYSGNISELIRRNIISDFRGVIKHHTSIQGNQKKCAYIFQEAVNNIFNYYSKNSFLDKRKFKIDCFDYNSVITLEFVSDMYQTDVPPFKRRFAELNALQKQELKKEFQLNLDAPILKENSANLGLLSIMLKSNDKLNYQFIDIDDVFCTFTLVNHIK